VHSLYTRVFQVAGQDESQLMKTGLCVVRWGICLVRNLEFSLQWKRC